MKKNIVILCIWTISAMLVLTSCMVAIPQQANIIPQKNNASMPSSQPLKLNTLTADVLLKPMASGEMSDISLAIPIEFNITRPSEDLTTTLDKYFITGTSNPKIPVYFGDKEIERLGTNGTFGILVDLKMGVNDFTFSQGEKTKKVKITRRAYAAPESVPISEITQSSIVPAVFSGVKVGQDLEVGCIAPSGAAVTASFGGSTVQLKQVATTQKAGTSAFFKGSIAVDGGDYQDDITQNAGKVTYRLEYKGKSKTYKSTGDVYVAGSDSNISVRVQSYMGFVYPDTNNLHVFREKLKEGAVDYLRSQDNKYAELSSGGYVPKEMLSVVEGEVRVANKLSKVIFTALNKGEEYTFSGTNMPVYATKLADGKFSVTLFNTTGSPNIDVSGSKLFSGVSVAEDKNYVTYTFTVKNAGRLWGYNVNYDGTKTVLSFKYRPALGTGSRPFAGMTIMLDPGHGGEDNGAFGLAGTTGPAENDVNLAHAYVARDLLESMGAKVVLTRSGNTFFSLDDRLRAIENANADFFISIHHNSVGENIDANKVSGMEIYYHTVLSRNFANRMMSGLLNGLNRSNRRVAQSYYRVTLSPYAPAILVELGFMSNPLEYERAVSKTQIGKVADAIADGIIRTLS